MKKISLFFLLIIIITSCTERKNHLNKITENDMINLQICYDLLDKLLDDETINEILNMQSADDMIRYHLSIGMYIRNNWIRHGSLKMHKLLSKELKLDSFRFHIDDISRFILEGYWHYLHKEYFDIEKIYNEYGYSFLSASVPEIDENMKNEIGKKLVERVYYKYNGLLYFIHVYKIKKSSEYYIYDIIHGWNRINEIEYNKLYNKWNNERR